MSFDREKLSMPLKKRSGQRKKSYQRNEPLSKHFPKEILNSPMIGASKNLLIQMSEIGNGRNSEQGPSHYRGRRYSHARAPSYTLPSIFDEVPISKPNPGGMLVDSRQMREDQGADNQYLAFPYRRGLKTLQYQEAIKANDDEKKQNLKVWGPDLE